MDSPLEKKIAFREGEGLTQEQLGALGGLTGHMAEVARQLHLTGPADRTDEFNRPLASEALRYTQERYSASIAESTEKAA